MHHSFRQGPVMDPCPCTIYVFGPERSSACAGRKTVGRSKRRAFAVRAVAATGGYALQAPLAMYPLGASLILAPFRRVPVYLSTEGPNATSLPMHPLVGYTSQAKGYVKKERRFHIDAPVCRFSGKKNPGAKNALRATSQ